MAYLKSYFDESMSHDTADPKLLVVGGCTMSSDSWLILESEWQAVLKEFGIKCYRSSDCNASKREYLGWDGPKKDALRIQLIETIHRSWRGKRMPICPVFIWCELNAGIFDRVSSEYPHIKVSPYEFCVMTILAGTMHAIANLEGENEISLFFEAGQPMSPRVRAQLTEDRQEETRIVDMSFVQKKDHVPLQVADMIAYEAWKSRTEGMRKVLIELLESGVGNSIDISEQAIRNAFNGWLKSLQSQ